MNPLSTHLPEFANQISSAAQVNPVLKEVLRDFERACAHSDDPNSNEKDRADWAELRDELVNELRRAALRIDQNQKRKSK